MAGNLCREKSEFALIRLLARTQARFFYSTRIVLRQRAHSPQIPTAMIMALTLTWVIESKTVSPCPQHIIHSWPELNSPNLSAKCPCSKKATCEKLVHDQHLQHQGWRAVSTSSTYSDDLMQNWKVVANLEDVVAAYRESWNHLEANFTQFLKQKEANSQLLQKLV